MAKYTCRCGNLFKVNADGTSRNRPKGCPTCGRLDTVKVDNGTIALMKFYAEQANGYDGEGRFLMSNSLQCGRKVPYRYPH